MKEIRGDAKEHSLFTEWREIRDRLLPTRVSLGDQDISELMEDLTAKFLDSYDSKHERSAVEGYGHYFLGSIIISDRDGRKYIIDGQQRLTSLTLLLIFLHNNLADAEQQGQLAELIFSQKFGKKSFNLDVPERTPWMGALYAGQIL